MFSHIWIGVRFNGDAGVCILDTLGRLWLLIPGIPGRFNRSTAHSANHSAGALMGVTESAEPRAFPPAEFGSAIGAVVRG